MEAARNGDGDLYNEKEHFFVNWKRKDQMREIKKPKSFLIINFIDRKQTSIYFLVYQIGFRRITSQTRA